MSIYIALGLGGMGVMNKVEFDNAIKLTLQTIVPTGRESKISINKENEGDTFPLPIIPLSIGYLYVDGRMQAKAEIAGSLLAWKCFEQDSVSLRDLGHLKVSAGYRVSERVTVSGLLGLGLTKTAKWNVKDGGETYELVKKDRAELDGLNAEVFLGLEGQYEVRRKTYIMLSFQWGLPFMNGLALDESRLKAKNEATVSPDVVLSANPKGNATITTGRLMVGFMYEIGGF